MKVKPKKTVEAPAQVKAFIDKVLANPLEQIADVLENFTWQYEKGDFYHWVPLFNYFDTFFEKFITPRQDLQLNYNADQPDDPFPLRNVLSVLRVTELILENCNNKHLYQSYEHLTRLLACTDRSVVTATLGALVVFVRKTHASSVRWHGFPELNSRLLCLAQGWGGKEEGLEMVACASDDESKIQAGLARGTTLHFEFYDESAANSGQGDKPAGRGLKVIELPSLEKYPETEYDIMQQLVQKYNIPVSLRFPLLARVQIAKEFRTKEGRRSLIRVRLFAFYVLFQSNPGHEDMMSFFVSEPEFVSELVGLLQAEENVPDDLRMLALRALAVQLLDRSRHSAVISAISGYGQSGLLSNLMHQSVASLTGQSGANKCYNVHFVEALLSLVGALVASTSGCNALSEAGLIPALLPLLKDTEPSHVSLVTSTVRILEAFMDFSPSASTLFRDLGGLTDMIHRLKVEVGLDEAQGGDDAAAARQVPYPRRLLLKSLLRAIALASYAPRSGARPQDEDANELYVCLREVFVRPKDFGSSLFSLAASVVTDLIHHDPLVFNTLDAAGLPEAFIQAVKTSVLPASDAVSCIPNTLVALCLNNNGCERVKQSRALDCFIPIFTTKQYLKALQSDTPLVLGNGLDELLRHAVPLKKDGIEMIIAIFQRLCLLGGDESVLEGKSNHEAMDTDVKPSDPMDTDGGARSAGEDSTEAVPSSLPSTSALDVSMSGSPTDASEATSFKRAAEIPPEVVAQLKDPDLETYLPDCVSFSARMLEPLLSNPETSRAFVEHGGVDLLLRLYRLPRLPPEFGCSPAQHSLLATFRTFTPVHAASISQQLKTALAETLSAAALKAQEVGGVNVCELPANEREGYVRHLASTDGLTGLASAVVRNSTSMLLDVSGGDLTTILNMGQLERVVAWQYVIAEEWRQKQDAGPKVDDARENSGVNAMDEDTSTAALAGSSAEGDVAMAASSSGADADEGNAEDIPTAVEGDRETPAPAASKAKKKAPEIIAHEALQHFTETARGFYTAVAKAIHTPLRRRDELAMQPTPAMRVAAVNLALVLRDNLLMKDVPLGNRQMLEVGSLPDDDLKLHLRYLQRSADLMAAVLFDNRRRTCHTLVLNYFVQGKGLDAFFDQLDVAVRCMLVAADREAAGKMAEGPSDVAGTSVQGMSEQVVGDAAGPSEAAQPTSSPPASPVVKQATVSQLADSVLHSFLLLLEQLSNAILLLGSPHATTLLVAPAKSQNTASQDAEGFVRNLQNQVLQAVLPIWSHHKLLSASPRLSTTVVSILTSCMEGTGRAMQRIGRGAAGRMTPQPNAQLVDQISEMGFSRPRAEEVLRRVGNNVELAMELLINLPEEAAPAGGAAPSTVDDDAMSDTLLQMLLQQPAPLAAPEAPSTSSGAAVAPVPVPVPVLAPAPVLTPVPKGNVPSNLQLVDGALNVLETVPTAAFSLADLVSTVGDQDGGQDRTAVVGHLAARLRGEGPADVAMSSRNAGAILAPAHLLAIMLAEQSQNAEAAVAAGVQTTALEFLEAWVEKHSREAPRDGHDPMATDSQMEAVPKWVDALVLILDALVQAQAKQQQPTPSPPQPAVPVRAAEAPPAADLVNPIAGTMLIGGQAARLPNLQQDQQAAVAAGIAMGEAPAAAANLVAQLEQAMGQAAADMDTAEGPNDSEAPPPPPAAPEEPSGPPPPPSSGGPSSSHGATSSQQSGPSSHDAAVGAQWQQLLTNFWRPGGLLTPEEQDRVVAAAMKLLNYLHVWGVSWKTPEGPSSSHDAMMSDPASTAHAVLQLLARLTKRHDVALKVLGAKGPRLLLTLPCACLTPELEPFIIAVIRHIIEDPATLQAAMEAEIRNTLSSRNRPSDRPLMRYGINVGSGSLPVKSFLQSLAPVIAREPAVFMEALKATCAMEEPSGPDALMGRAGRAVISLKKNKEPRADKPSTADAQGQQAGPSTAGPSTAGPSNAPSDEPLPTPQTSDRHGKRSSLSRDKPDKHPEAHKGPHKATKKVPSSFAEVVDSLVDVLLRYKGVPFQEPAAEDTAAAVQPSDQQPAASASSQPSEAAGTGVNRVVVAPTANGIGIAARGARGGLPRTMAALAEATAAAAPVPAGGAAVPSPILAPIGIPTERQRQILLQNLALKMLTDFTLMYSGCVGVLLKRDLEGPAGQQHHHHHRGTPSSAKFAEHGSHAGVLLKHVMHVQLAFAPEHPWGMQGLAESASFFLLAICIRSAEGRKRIVTEIVRVLTCKDSGDYKVELPPVPAAVSASISFVQKPGCPPPIKVKAFVELVSHLLSGSQTGGNRSSNAASGLSSDMVRTMREAGMVKALTRALKTIDLDHPKAPKSVHSLLKPLEMLTRSWAKLKQQAERSAPAATQEAAPAEGQAAPDHGGSDAAQGNQTAGQQQQQGAGGMMEDEPHEESEAGPQAVAIAERAMEAYDREHGDEGRRIRRSMEDMMDAIIEQAYAEEGLEAFHDDSDEESDAEDEELEEEMVDAVPLPELEENDVSGDEESGQESDEVSDEGFSDDGDEDEEVVDADVVIEAEEEDDMGGLDDDDDDDDDHLRDEEVEEDEEDDDEEDEEDEGIDDEDDDAQDVEDVEQDDEDGPEFDEWEDNFEDDEDDDNDDGEEASPRWQQQVARRSNSTHVPRRLTQLSSILPQQLLDDIMSGMVGRPGERRRYRIISRRDGQQQTGTLHAAPPGAVMSSQHSLLARPNAGGLPAQLRMRGAELDLTNALGAPPVLEGRLPGGDELRPQLMMQTGRGGPGQDPYVSFTFDWSLFNLAQRNGRPESRLTNWSDDGGVSRAMLESSNALAGSLENAVVGMLRQLNPPAAPAPQAELVDMPRLEPMMPAAPEAAATGQPVAEPAAAAPVQQPAERQEVGEQAAAVASQPSEAFPTTISPAPEPPAPQPSQDASQMPTPQPAAAIGEQDLMQALQAAFAAVNQNAADEGAAGEERAPDVMPQLMVLNPQLFLRAQPVPEPVAPEAEDDAGPTPMDVGDEHMETVEEDAAAEAQAGGSGSQEGGDEDNMDEGPQEQVDKDEPGTATEGASGEGAAEGVEGAAPVDPIIHDAGIDPAFLEALPPELRAEVLATHRAQVGPSPAAAAAGPEAAAEDDAMEGIDPEFIAALPPEIQAEVLEQQRQQRRREAAIAQQQQQAAQQVNAPAGGASGEMDMASILATFPPEVREEVLLTSDESLLASLPPALLAEAQSLRERAMRTFRVPMGTGSLGRGFLFTGAPRLNPMGYGGLHPGEVTARRGSRGSAAAAAASTAGAAKKQKEAVEAAPEVDEEALMTLVQLLRLPQPLGKSLLQRLFLNLCQHQTVRKSVLRILLSILRGPLTWDEASKEEVGGEVMQTPRTLTDALQSDGVIQEMSVDSEPAGPKGYLFGRSADGGVIPPLVTRRVLELATYIAKHQPKAAKQMVSLYVPTPEAQAASVAALTDRKGKGKVVERMEGPQNGEDRTLEVLLGMVGRTFCMRSNSHLEATLHLLEVVLTNAKQSISEIEAAAVSAKVRRNLDAGVHLTQLFLQSPPTLEAAPAEQDTPAAPDASAEPAAATAAPAEAEGAATSAEVTAEPVSATPQPPAGPLHVGPSPTPADGSAEGAADASGSAGRAKEIEAAGLQVVLPEDPTPVLESIPQDLLRRIPELLGQASLADATYNRCSSVLKLMSDCSPSHKPFLIAVLAEQAHQLAEQAGHELGKLMATGFGSAVVTGSSMGTVGVQELRVLQALTSLIKKKLPAGAIEPQQQDYSEEDVSLVESLAVQLDPLWQSLSKCISSIEAELRTTSGSRGEAGSASTRILPPGASRVLPLVEAYFVLCGALADLHPHKQPETPLGRRTSVLLERGATAERAMSVEMAGTSTSSNNSAGMPPLSVLLSEGHVPYFRFAEKHRRLLNAFVRQTPALLEGSFAPLLKVPRLVEFDNKRVYFRSRIRSAHDERHYGTLRICVRREYVFEDSFHQLRLRTPEEMRCKLSVQFQREEGIDAGGVSREWYQVMAREIFNPNISLFLPVPEGGTTFQPNPNSVVQNDETRGTNHLDFFKFVGRIIGKALFDGQHVDAHFTRSFYKHMLGQQLTYEDIEAVDPEYYKNLIWILEHDPEILDLTFTMEVDYFGRKEIVELKPGGASIKVTEDNKREYVNLVARHRMTTAIRSQISAFLEGFWDLIPRELISMFNDNELELLISGLPEIDVEDLRNNTEYTGYTAASSVIQWFWEIVREMDSQDLALLVQFVTGTAKVPLEGFKALQGVSGPQKFHIHKAYGPADRLPSAHTCFNQLDLIDYDSKEQLRERLLMAIHEGSEGFGFG